jgi:hypothetical protein
MIKPLRDLIVAVPCEEVGRVGALYMPDNTLQALRTHRKMLVLYSGPEAKELCPSGTIVHASDIWGDVIEHKERKMWIGRLRDVNGICAGEEIKDTNKYSD